jgi:hypothetical protein
VTDGTATPPSTTVSDRGIAVEVAGGADPAVVAVLAAAVDAVWPRARPMAGPERDRIPAWRFSGRWWSRPASVRRDRPWT